MPSSFSLPVVAVLVVIAFIIGAKFPNLVPAVGGA